MTSAGRRPEFGGARGAMATPFARITSAEIRGVMLACGAPTQWCVLLALMERRQRCPDGRWIVSRPRAEVARELGISSRAVSDAVRKLMSAGAIEVVARGHNGRASVYAIRDAAGLGAGP